MENLPCALQAIGDEPLEIANLVDSISLVKSDNQSMGETLAVYTFSPAGERSMKVVALAGGVGGAKLVDGLGQIIGPDSLSVIVNTGDDFEYLGLQISPDLDTVCYTLADLANPTTGWGLRDETWTTFDTLAGLGGLAWFHLGDKDLATHLYRTEALKQGKTLSQITQELCQQWGVDHPVYPMSDDPVRTIVKTRTGESLGFQEYFVHQRCEPEVTGFDFVGAVGGPTCSRRRWTPLSRPTW